MITTTQFKGLKRIKGNTRIKLLRLLEAQILLRNAVPFLPSLTCSFQVVAFWATKRDILGWIHSEWKVRQGTLDIHAHPESKHTFFCLSLRLPATFHTLIHLKQKTQWQLPYWPNYWPRPKVPWSHPPRRRSILRSSPWWPHCQPW